MIRLRTLGGLGLAPEPASGTPQPRRLAILARLAVAGEVGVSRDTLLGQLWPDTDEPRARHALTQALYGIRRDLGGAVQVQGTGSLRLNDAVVSSDVADFRAALRQGDRRAAVEAYGGEFLAGFYVKEADEFERWVEETRRDLAREYRQVLETLAAEGDAVTQLPWLERLAALDPLDSRSALRLAQAQEAVGSPAVALRSLQAHQELVAQELGAPVGREILALIQQLEREAKRQLTLPATPRPARAVDASAPATALPAPAPAARPSTRRRSFRVAVWLVVLAAAGALGARALAGKSSALDPQKYVVVPFRSAATEGDLLSGANCAQLVSAMLEGWRDVRRVDPLRLASVLAQADQPADLNGLLRLARSLGAGRVIWGDVKVVGDSLRIRGAVFDASRRNADPLREASFSVPLELLAEQGALTRALGTRFAALTRDLIVPGSSELAGAGIGTQYASALQLKLRGDSALAQWNLPLARESYRLALSIDPAWPQANLNLAQVEQWSGTDRDAWRPYVVTAMVDTAKLPPAQRVQAFALRALADEDYPGACERYRGMIARDSADFVAWYGLAECLADDRMVLADESSPSGYRYRTSYREALRAYERALTLVPLTSSAFGGAALTRLVDRTFAEPNIFRLGFVNGDPAQAMAAFPGYLNDTLSFVPYPVNTTLNELVSPGKREAVAEARRTLLRITGAWTAALPSSAPALEAHVTALELAYPITGRMADSAMGLLRRARAAEPASVRLRFQMVRVMLKAGDYAGVVALADSTIAMAPGMSREDLELAAILAALRGKRDLAANLHEQTAETRLYTLDGQEVEVPLPVSKLGNRLLVYAAFGGPVDSLRSLQRAIMKATEGIADSGSRHLAKLATIERPQVLTFPLMGPPRDLGHVFSVEAALDRGDIVAASTELHRLKAARNSPVDALPADATNLEARLWLAAADTTESIGVLEPFLTRVATSGLNLLPSVEHGAAFGRIVELLIRLADERPPEVRHRYSTILTALWHQP